MPKKENHGNHMQNYDETTGRWASGKTTNGTSDNYQGTKKVDYKPQEQTFKNEEEKERKSKMDKAMELKNQKIDKKEDFDIRKLELILRKFGIEEEKITAILNELNPKPQENKDITKENEQNDDVEEEYNAEEMVKRILGKDFKLDKDAKMQELVKRKYGKLL